MSEEATSASANGEVSAEDAERMAAEFRPAWELDDAPFTAPAAPLPESAVDALAKTSLSANPGQMAAAAPVEFVAPPPPRTPSFDPALTQQSAQPAPVTSAAAPAQQNAHTSRVGVATQFSGSPMDSVQSAQSSSSHPPGPHMAKTLMGMPAAAPIGVPVSPAGAPPPPNMPANLGSTMLMSQNPGLNVGANAGGHAAQAVMQNFPEPERPIIRSERPPAIDVGMRNPSRPPPRPANVRPIIDTMPTADRSADFAVPRKSNLGMIAGITAGALAIIGVIIAVKFATDTPHPATTSPSYGGANNTATGSSTGGMTTSAAQAHKDDIPPVTAKEELPTPDPNTTATKPPVLSQDIPVMKPASLPPAQATQASRPPVAAQPRNPPAQAAQTHATYQAPPPVTASKPPTSKPPTSGGGIVRDAPF
jgi:hypothetical protein